MDYYKGSCLWSRVHAHLTQASAAPAAADSVLLRGLPAPMPCGRGAGIPALSTWHLVKCQLGRQLCPPPRPCPVRASSRQPPPVSMSQRATSQLLVLRTVAKRIPFMTNEFRGVEATRLLTARMPGDRGRLPWAPLRPSCAGDWLSGTGELLPSWWSFGFFSLKKMHVVCQVV